MSWRLNDEGEGLPPDGHDAARAARSAGRGMLWGLVFGPLGVLWALPWTLSGVAVGLLGLLSGGRVRWRWPTVEFYGGAVHGLLRILPNDPIAMTLGHAILGRNAAALDIARSHELVHVRQYARWGLLFVPAYALCSAWLWFRGRDAYRDNPFEREAYGENDVGFRM
jgi:hypothetical protein